MARKRTETQEAQIGSRLGSLAYIVDLPKDDEAALARSKFEKAVRGLRRVYPKITEARATVKVSSPLGERRRFEVQAFVKIPSRQFDFNAEGWSLAETFDKIAEKLKRLRIKPEKKPSYRRRPSRAERESHLETTFMALI